MATLTSGDKRSGGVGMGNLGTAPRLRSPHPARALRWLGCVVTVGSHVEGTRKCGVLRLRWHRVNA